MMGDVVIWIIGEGGDRDGVGDWGIEEIDEDGG